MALPNQSNIHGLPSFAGITGPPVGLDVGIVLAVEGDEARVVQHFKEANAGRAHEGLAQPGLRLTPGFADKG